MITRERAGSILQSPGPGWEYREGEHGGEWVEKSAFTEKVNPYAGSRKISKARKTVRGLPDQKGQRWGVDYNPLKRSAPSEKGYSWQMGYNNLVGRYTQGSLFPELSGSSLNRKKNEKKLPASAGHILALVDKAETECLRRRIRVFECGPEGRKISLGEVVARIYILVDIEDIRGAGELAVWLSEKIRECTRGISFGVHVLSARSRGKIKDKATAFFRACPGNRVFATLGFIAKVDDRTAVAILNSFLTQMRKKFPGLQYFWVAERQTGERNEARGVYKEATNNVHFHMILNKRLPVGRWNAMWVLAQYNAGLSASDKYGQEITKEEILRLYALDQKEGYCGGRSVRGKRISRIQEVLNPFDIKKVTSISKLSSYLTKYITKQEKDKPFGCAVWHCSRRVSRVFTRQTVGPSAFAYMKSFANWGVNKTTGEVWAQPEEYRCGNGFAVVVYANDKAAPLRYLKRMEQVNKWVLEGHEIDRLPMLDDDLFRKLFVCKN